MSLSPDQVTAVVLAGGFGTRVKHLVQNLPKPMAPICKRPFLEWVVCFLARQQIRRVILSTGYMAETVERHFRSQPVKGVSVRCVPETQPLGTAGGFLNAIGNTGDSPAAWMVLNGDSLALAPLDNMFRSLDEADVAGAILGVSMMDGSRYGTILQDGKNMLSGFEEKRPGAGIVNAGIYLFRATVVATFPNHQPLSFEADVFPWLLARKARLRVCVTDAPFLDIGTPESLAKATLFVEQNLASLTQS